jgi:hypothetical protein
MRKGSSKRLFLLAGVLFVCMALSLRAAQPSFEKMRKSADSPGGADRGSLMVQLPSQFLVATMTGFKDVVASALWVRADQFFHTGQYQAIMPIVRMVTWLDPHNIDVFTTGAWHLDYNFVDDEQRSDKRYIPASIALLKEGIKSNPETWELYFELGWTHYNKKIEDNEKALYYMEKACHLEGFDPNTGKEVPRPEYTDRMVAHQYEKLGRFEEAIKRWGIAKKRILTPFQGGQPMSIVDEASVAVCDRNLGLLYLRMAYRYSDMNAYKKAVDIYKNLASGTEGTKDVVDTYRAISVDYARRVARNDPPSDAKKPLDAKFEVTWRKTAPKIFVLSGKINIIPSSEFKGSRVYWMLTDADYKMPELKTFDWHIDTSKTVVWDSAYVGGGTFSQVIDLSKNNEFYPFLAKKYKLTIWFKPQSPGTPDFVQDRIGWRGEALTDKNYLVTTPQPDIRMTEPGFRILKKEIILDRSDIM